MKGGSTQFFAVKSEAVEASASMMVGLIVGLSVLTVFVVHALILGVVLPA